MKTNYEIAAFIAFAAIQGWLIAIFVKLSDILGELKKRKPHGD